MFNRLNPEARIAMMQAIDEARDLGHAEVGAAHVLLGLLANVRGETYALLTAQGLDFESARTIVIERHADSHRAAAAATRVDQPTELDEDREALNAIGIDLDKVRDAVRSAFGDDITERWGERGRRGHRDRHRPGRDGSRGGGRGRRGPRSERFSERLPFTAPLREALRATVRDARPARPEEGGHRPGGPRMTAGALLLAISRSHDPVVDAVLGWADDQAALRAAIEKYAGQPAT
jgi:Clp amino terminal domain, pathogenicity island component